MRAIHSTRGIQHQDRTGDRLAGQRQHDDPELTPPTAGRVAADVFSAEFGEVLMQEPAPHDIEVN